MNFETNRNLISSVEHGFTDSIISKYSYTNDLLGRRTGKVQYFDNKVKNFDFGYNPRSEETSATEQNNANFNYGFNYDNIGNRINSTESGISKSYETNSLNQYTANSVDTGFTPTYDADGNQTRIKTSAGIFTVEYNAENRPIQFKGSMGRTYNMSYDYMGRRFYMSSYFQGMHDGDSTELFYYNGYTLIESQQILLGPNAMRFAKSYIWDPTTKQATRPLAMFNSNSKTLSDARLRDVNFRDVRFDVMLDNSQNIHYYTHDANKNVTELISDSGAISAHYEYSPFGATIASSGDLSYSNPFQFSSEFSDHPLGLIYYNYRHYNPLDGRWISRDPIAEFGGFNLYGMVKNNCLNDYDLLGLASFYALDDHIATDRPEIFYSSTFEGIDNGTVVKITVVGTIQYHGATKAKDGNCYASSASIAINVSTSFRKETDVVSKGLTGVTLKISGSATISASGIVILNKNDSRHKDSSGIYKNLRIIYDETKIISGSTFGLIGASIDGTVGNKKVKVHVGIQDASHTFHSVEKEKCQ